MQKSSDTIREVLKGLAPEQLFYVTTATKSDPRNPDAGLLVRETSAELRGAARDKAIDGITVLILYDAAAD